MEYLDPITRRLTNNIFNNSKSHGCLYWVFIGWFLVIFKIGILIVWFIPIGFMITTINIVFRLLFRQNKTIDINQKIMSTDKDRPVASNYFKNTRQEIPINNFTFKVAGTTYNNRDKILKRFAREITDSINKDDKYYGLNNREILEDSYFSEYGKCYELSLNDSYINHPINLNPEPNNQYDSNAIQVFIDSKMIGYVESKSTYTVREILTKNPRIYAQLTGGKYKYPDLYNETVKIITDNYGVIVTLEYFD